MCQHFLKRFFEQNFQATKNNRGNVGWHSKVIRIHPWRLTWNIFPWRFGESIIFLSKWVMAVGASRWSSGVYANKKRQETVQCFKKELLQSNFVAIRWARPCKNLQDGWFFHVKDETNHTFLGKFWILGGVTMGTAEIGVPYIKKNMGLLFHKIWSLKHSWLASPPDAATAGLQD